MTYLFSKDLGNGLNEAVTSDTSRLSDFVSQISEPRSGGREHWTLFYMYS